MSSTLTCLSTLNTLKHIWSQLGPVPNGTKFFRKIYLSLYLKGYESYYLWEVSWRLNRTATYWPPQLFWLQQHFFLFFWAAQPGGLGTQLLLGHGSYSSIFSPTDLNLLSLGLYNNLTPTYFLWASKFILNSTIRQSRLSPDIFDRMHLLFTQVHFFFWQLGRGQYVTVILIFFLLLNDDLYARLTSYSN